jgi:hypothetical protein
MAKQTVKNKATHSEQPAEIASPKKRRKWPWFLLFLVLLIGGSLYGLYDMGFLDRPIHQLIKTGTSAPEQLTADWAADIPPVTPLVIAPSPTVEPPSPIAQRPATPARRYYLSLGSCFYPDCLKNKQAALKEQDLPMVSRRQTKATQYYEVISAEAFSQQRAMEKIQIINRYNRMVGFPVLVGVTTDRYKISFGQFPSKANGLRMQSHLAHLYPQIKVRFSLNAKSDRYEIIRVYTGPFTRQAAERHRETLSGHPLFGHPELTTKL